MECEAWILAKGEMKSSGDEQHGHNHRSAQSRKALDEGLRRAHGLTSRFFWTLAAGLASTRPWCRSSD